MRPRSGGGGGCATEGRCCYSSARLLVGGGGVSPAAATPAPSPRSLDAERARLENALCATTAVLFAASVSYIALSTLFACFCAARRPQRPDASETKRALEEIPVVVMHVRDDPDGGRGRDGGVEQEQEDDEAAAGEECAVCLAEYASGEEVRVLPACRHRFHRECVDRWLLARAPTCPVCRAPVAATSEGRDAKGCATGGAALLVVGGP